jgi:colanic acid biosynthesis glycosyl transferase WcaI
MAHRVLYLSPYFWPEEIGSAPYCTDLAVWLHERGHDVHVVAFRPHYPSAQQFGAWADGSRDDDSLDGIPINRVPVTDRGRGGFKDRIKNDTAILWQVCLRALRGDFRKTGVIVAYVPSILTLYSAQVVRLLTGARIIAVIHDIESGLASSLGLVTNRALLFFMRLVERVGLNRADHIVVLTEGMKDEILRIGCHRPITVLSLWASLSPASPAPTEGAVVVMYSGNFGKKQNLDQLLPLVKRLSDEKNSIHVVMRGDGSEMERIKTKFKEAQVTNTVFLPLAPAREFMSALHSAHIHLVPQALNVANYALPSKLFSIMSAGRPFVCIAEEGGLLDHLARQSGAGVCIRPGDEESLYRVVVDLAGDFDRQTRMGESGRLFVDRYMNKQAILRAYDNLISG